MQILCLFLIAISSLSASRLQAAVCDRKAEPWLDANCEMPNPSNPNHACRYSAYLKAQKVDPFDPSLAFTIEHITFESYQSLAASTCDLIKQFKCASVVSSMQQRFLAAQAAYLSSESTGLPLSVDLTTQSASLRDGNLYRNYDFLDSKSSAIVLSIRNLSAEMPSVVSSVASDETMRKANLALQNKIKPIRDSLNQFLIGAETFGYLKSQFAKDLSTISLESVASADDFDCSN